MNHKLGTTYKLSNIIPLLFFVTVIRFPPPTLHPSTRWCSTINIQRWRAHTHGGGLEVAGGSKLLATEHPFLRCGRGAGADYECTLTLLTPARLFSFFFWHSAQGFLGLGFWWNKKRGAWRSSQQYQYWSKCQGRRARWLLSPSVWLCIERIRSTCCEWRTTRLQISRGGEKNWSFLTAQKVNTHCRRPLSPPRRYSGPRLRLSAPLPNYWLRA